MQNNFVTSEKLYLRIATICGLPIDGVVSCTVVMEPKGLARVHCEVIVTESQADELATILNEYYLALKESYGSDK